MWGIGLCLAGRLFALGFGLLLWENDRIPAEPDYAPLTELDPEPVMGPLSGWTTGLWQRHDTLHYLEIAEHGYERREQVIVFPPGYPLVVRGAGWLTGGNLLVAALAVSTISCALALAVLYRLAEDLLGTDRARWAGIYQLVFPTGYILLAAYAEPLMLLLVVLAFYLARSDHWGWAAIAAFGAGATRLQAVVLIVPLLVVAWRRFGREWWRRPAVLVAAAAAPAALVAYQLYLMSADLPTVGTV